MADQATIFSQGANTPSNPDSTPASGITAPNNGSLEDLLGSIKNERGEPKYRTIQDALNALKHSQDYIPTLKNTLTQKEQELETAKQALTEMDELKRTVQELTQRTGQQPTTQATNGLTEEQIAEMIDRTMSTRQQQAVRQSNVEKVVSTLQEVFGSEAENKFYARAAELGMSKQEINDLAARTPNAVLELVGVKKQNTPSTSFNTTSVNTGGLQPNQETFVRRNSTISQVGATTQELHKETVNAKSMVEELHAQGKSVYDLTDPKVYFKYFGN